MFHSLLSFALNTKMLDPREVVARADAAWRAGCVSLATAEGFIRQIIGWREYIRGFYWAHMPEYVEQNVFDHTRALPGWFWNGQTRMRCLAHAIGQSLEQAYAHHIQRTLRCWPDWTPLGYIAGISASMSTLSNGSNSPTPSA